MEEKEIKYCKCGCGQIVKKKFIIGHHLFGENNPAKKPGIGKKISEAKKGHLVSEETRKKISESFKKRGGHPFRGTILSKEHKEKISIANKGKKRTEEAKKNISLAHIGINTKENHPMWGKKHSEESKMKISKSHTGLKHSKETCMKMSESRQGNKTNLWKGGISFDPYTVEFNKTLKRKIKIRDNHLCQNPYCVKQNVKLHVHHINYIKTNQNINNLITLCGNHHSQTTAGDREYYQFFL
jgi:hypothetical protein